MSVVICANESCSKTFFKKVHNAMYCSPECRRVITNQKVLDKYYEKKDKKAQRGRICRLCPTILSRYNEDDFCGPCGVTLLKDRLESWGWDRATLDEDFK